MTSSTWTNLQIVMHICTDINRAQCNAAIITYTITLLHTYTYVLKSTYIHAYTHTIYIHTYVHTYIHTYIQYIHTYIHTYVHTYIIHTYLCTYVHTFHLKTDVSANYKSAFITGSHKLSKQLHLSAYGCMSYHMAAFCGLPKDTYVCCHILGK